MSLTPLNFGSLAIHEDVLKYSYTENNEGVTCQRTWHGPLADIHAAAQKIGQRMMDVPYKPFVDQKVITQPAPGRGELVVVARLVGEEIGTIDGQAEPPTYEVEWGTLEKPLLSHPRYVKAGVNEPGPDGSSIADYITQWRNATAKERKEIAGKIPSGSPAAGMWTEITKKINKGIESYIIPVPVARKTSRTYRRPTTSAMGKIQTPPGFPGLPVGYEWLCTADRCTRTGRAGKWERIQEWTGGDSVDTDLYEKA